MTRTLMSILLIGATSVAGASMAGAQTADPELQISVPYEHFTLPNGMDVIVHQDTTTPVIASNIWFHVGSGAERPGRTGFAHLFEHIMFEGSANVPRGKIDEWFEEVGGAPNGSTTRDRTNYMQSFSSNALELALFIESDRMGYLLETMTPAKVDGQRGVVMNERRQRYDNPPYGLAHQILSETLYDESFPYHWPVIGYMDDLEAADRDDVVDFFERFYAPNNASLALVGDLDVEEARTLVETWFGEIPAGPAVETPAVEPPTLTHETRLVLEDRVQLPRLYMAWITPPAFEDGDAELTALAQLLTGGKNSRLYHRLVYDLEIAADVSARQGFGKLAGDFTITATARAGHTLEELESVILEELERIKAEAPRARELERIVNQHEAGFLERLELPATKADLLNSYAYYTGTPDYFEEDLARSRSLTPTRLSEAAAEYLDPDRRVVLSIVPNGRLELAAPESRVIEGDGLMLSPQARTGEGTVGSTPATRADDQAQAVAGTDTVPGVSQRPDRSKPPAVGPVPELELPPVHRLTLQNGLDVLVLEKRDVPLVQVNVHVHAGSADDPSDRLGLAGLSAELLAEGAAGRDALELADTLEYLGARFGVRAGTHLSTASLRVPTARLDDGLGVLSDIVTRPDLPEAELDRLRRERITTLIRRHDAPSPIAASLFQETVYGEDHPYGRSAIGTAETLEAITTDEVRAFHEARYRPENATLVVVGDVDPATIGDRLESAFGGWHADGAGPAARSDARSTVAGSVEPVRDRTVYLVDMPGAAQSIIQIGHLGTDRFDEEYYALQVMNTILGGAFTSRLNQNLREDKGYTYGARSSFDFRPVAGPFVAGAAVQTDATAPALVEFMNELEAIRTNVTSEEVERAKNFLAMRYPSTFQSVSGIAGQLADIVQYDLSPNVLTDYTERILAVTHDDVVRVAREYIDTENIAIVIVGDRSEVEDEVRDLELGTMHLLEVTDVLGPVPDSR